MLINQRLISLTSAAVLCVAIAIDCAAAEDLVMESPGAGIAVPAEAVDASLPTLKATAPDSIGISEWTRSAGPDDSLVIAGYGFDKRTRFVVTARGGLVSDATVRSVDAFRAVITLPPTLPQPGIYVLQAVAPTGSSHPVAINRTEIWYTIPRLASPGDRLSVFGRNLAPAESAAAWVCLKAKDGSGPGRILKSEDSNPYRVDVIIPETLAPGEYEVYLHSGLGGELGWGSLSARHGGAVASTHLTIRADPGWTGPTFNVVDFGAKGDGKSDDTAAVLDAFAKANATARSTLLFPAGTYLISEAIGEVTGPDDTGIRILGEGMGQTFIKGNPSKLPKQLLILKGNDVEVRDLALDINYLGEAEKLYRGAQRPAHDHARDMERAREKQQRDAEKAAAKHAENQRKREYDKWRKDKANKDKPVPEHLQPPPKPEKQASAPKPPSPGRVVEKKGWGSGLRIINCVIDAERWTILLNGLNGAVIENCDIIAKEAIISCPQYTRIDRCNFFARADAPVMMYAFGGWCNAITNCTGQDYMPNTYDTAMGRFYTVSAYGNRCENTYIADNQTFDLTVQPGHFNQNSGEQIMWEFIDPITTQAPTAISELTVTFPEAFKDEKIGWFTTAVVVAGRGLGQYRQVKAYDPATGLITLARPWRILPDTASQVLICRSVNRQVVYRNQLDAKPRAYQSESHIASAGVEPFGISFDLIIDSNRFTEMRSGLAIMGRAMSHLYQNNEFIVGRNGIARMPSGASTMGVIMRGNRVEGMLECGIEMGDSRSKGEVDAVCVIERNDLEGNPVGASVGGPRSTIATPQILVRDNRMALGSISADQAGAFRLTAPTAIIDLDNTIEGYQDNVITYPTEGK